MNGGDNRPKPEVLAPVSSWRLKGMDQTPGASEFLRKRSEAFQRATQRKGMPMTYGSGKKVE